MKRHFHTTGNMLETFAQRATRWTGTSSAFGLALLTIVVWAALGPHFHYSDTWQLVVNTGTTVITFLMVFLIQRSQNKDALAIQLKLNELVAALHGASNRMISVEELSEEDLQTLQRHYMTLAKLAARDRKLTESHSVEEATRRHELKLGRKDSTKQSD
jgi:low affinity Fe/Cu permease